MPTTIDQQIDATIHRLEMVYLTGRYDNTPVTVFFNAFELLEKLKENKEKLDDAARQKQLEYIIAGTAIVAIAEKLRREMNNDKNVPFFSTSKNFKNRSKDYAHALGLKEIHLQLFRGHGGIYKRSILERGKMAVDEHLRYPSEDENVYQKLNIVRFDLNDYKYSGFYEVNTNHAEDFYKKLYQQQENSRFLRKAGRAMVTILSGIFILPLIYTIPWLRRENAKDNAARVNENIQCITLTKKEYEEFKEQRQQSKMKSANIVAEVDLPETGSSTKKIRFSLNDLAFANKPKKCIFENKNNKEKVDLYMDKEQIERFNLFKAKKGEALTPEEVAAYAKHSPLASTFTYIFKK